MVQSARQALLAPAARRLFRTGVTDTTAGTAEGYVQANLVAVPAEWAYDVLLFAHRNPRACPLIDVVDTGTAPSCAPDSDLRTDCPRYQVWSKGVLVDEPTDVRQHWRPDLVAFLFASTLTFEPALARAGIPPVHYQHSETVPVYETNRAATPAARLSGPLLATMRQVPNEKLTLATWISSRFQNHGGAPLHIGDPRFLGISAIDGTWHGNAAPPRPGHTSMFWANALTVTAALIQAQAPLVITHAPGHLFVTDLYESTAMVDVRTEVSA